MQIEVLQNNKQDINKAVGALKRGEVVAIPTETVYGLAGSTFNKQSLLSIFKAKDRPFFDPLIVHVSSELLNSADPVEWLISKGLVAHSIQNQSNTYETYKSLILSFWPGPLTILFPKGERIDNVITSGFETVAIRCPSHPVTQEILQTLNEPLCAPSANRFGRISPTSASHVVEELGERIPFVVNGGECQVGVESTIIKVNSDGSVTVLRPGIIGSDQFRDRGFNISQLDNKPAASKTQVAAAPGMLESHYAPKTQVILLDGLTTADQIKASSVAILAHSRQQFEKIATMLNNQNILCSELTSESGDPTEVARNLYGALRALDAKSPGIIISERLISADAFSLAVNDRLTRAAAPRKQTPHHC